MAEVAIECRAVEVIDGDTVRCNGVVYRLMGLDTPEVRGKCPAERARALAATATLRGEIVRCSLTLEPTGRRERWGRRLAWARVCGQRVEDLLIGLSLARPYAGERRRSWCAPVPKARPEAVR